MIAQTLLLLPLLFSPTAASQAPATVGASWGVNIHSTARTLALGELTMLGRAFKIVRSGLNWKFIETKCGVYDFGATHSLLSLLRAGGIRVLLGLGGSNEACYPSIKPGACDTAACIAGYARFAAAALAEFKGTGVIWESTNEPNRGNDNATDLAQLVLATAPPFLARGEAFVGPAASEMDWPYLTAAFASGALRAFTGITAHPYRAGGPESMLADWATLRSLVDSYTPAGASRPPLMSGEWGWTSATASCNYGERPLPPPPTRPSQNNA